MARVCAWPTNRFPRRFPRAPPQVDITTKLAVGKTTSKAASSAGEAQWQMGRAATTLGRHGRFTTAAISPCGQAGGCALYRSRGSQLDKTAVDTAAYGEMVIDGISFG